MSGVQELRVEDVEAAVKEKQTTPGGMKLNIVLSPAINTLSIKSPKSASASPSTRREIDEKLSAAASRREVLDKLRANNIHNLLAKVDTVQTKKEELVAEKCQKSKEILESKLEAGERNREAVMAKNKEKMGEELAKVERTQRELEIQMEADRVAKDCALKAKLSKAQEKRDEQMEEIKKKIKEQGEKAVEVRSMQDKQITEMEARLETELNLKMEKAAKERERQEQELKHKLEERNRKAEIVRKNKEKLAVQENTVPESA